MKQYRHSGTFGDLIYSLYIVKKMGGGEFQIALQNIENCVKAYGYDPANIDPRHIGRFTEQDIAGLTPLLLRQRYINNVTTWRQGDPVPEVDLDQYRAVLYRTFEGNILQAYHMAFNLPFMMQDYDTPWLEADPKTVKPIVIARSSQYIPADGDEGWRNIIGSFDITKDAFFIGTPAEHSAFETKFGIQVDYYPVQDFLEMANVIAGADLMVSNQGFPYSLAIGLGKATVLEANKIVPLTMNECFFPRANTQYF